jgi:predicted metal-dependent phosphotriesterase family hydrolase
MYPAGRVLSIAEPAAASLDLIARRACRSPPTPTRKPGALEQQRIFAEEGVDLSRVVIVHSGDTAVTQEQIDTMLIHNPRTIFERHGS